MMSAGIGVPGHAEAEEERLVDLVAVDAERERAAEVEIGEPFLDLGIEAIGEVELQFGIRAVEAGIEMDLVFAARGVLQKHRQFRQIDEPLHVVELAGDGAQIDDFGVLGERELHLVEIGQLVAVGIDRPEIGIALQ